MRNSRRTRTFPKKGSKTRAVRKVIKTIRKQVTKVNGKVKRKGAVKKPISDQVSATALFNRIDQVIGLIDCRLIDNCSILELAGERIISIVFKKFVDLGTMYAYELGLRGYLNNISTIDNNPIVTYHTDSNYNPKVGQSK